MIDDRLNVSSQLFIPVYEYRFSSAPAMTSQIKGNRSIPRFRKVPSDMNIPSRMFSKSMDEK